jgi:hypothetical protein
MPGNQHTCGRVVRVLVRVQPQRQLTVVLLHVLRRAVRREPQHLIGQEG